MARSRKVEPEVALQAAMTAFWQHGYCSLGTRQIEDETGITRFTLQTAYGGKMPLFLKTLDTYLDLFENFTKLDPVHGNLEVLATWFEARVDPEIMPEPSCYGCLMLNTIVEFSAQNDEINQRVERYFAMLRNGFRAVLQAAKDNRTLPMDFDTEGKVEVLIGIALSLNIIIRAANHNLAGQHMATSTARMIREWAVVKPKS